jgi:hypothetical protein
MTARIPGLIQGIEYVIQDLNSFGEIIAHVQCSVDEYIYIYIPWLPHKNNCKTKIGSHDAFHITLNDMAPNTQPLWILIPLI